MAKKTVKISEKALEDLKEIKQKLLMPWNIGNGFDIGYGVNGLVEYPDGDKHWKEIATNIRTKEEAELMKRLSDIVCELTRER